MTPRQLDTIERIRLRGYRVDYDRNIRGGTIRVNMPAKLQAGTLVLLVCEDGTYRSTQYPNWDAIQRKAA